LACLTLLLNGSIAQIPAPITNLAEIPGGAYRLDPTHVSIVYRISHLGLSNLTGTFDAIEGELEFFPRTPERSGLRVVAGVASIDANNQIVEDVLLGERFFDAENYPQIIFETTDIEALSSSEGRIDGSLEMRGERHPVSLMATFNGYGVNGLTLHRTLGFSATMTLSRSQWDMVAYPAMIGDEVTLHIEAEFVKRNFEPEEDGGVFD